MESPDQPNWPYLILTIPKQTKVGPSEKVDPNEKVGPSEKSELSESVRPSKIAQTSLAPLPRLFGWSHFQNFILLVSVGRTD